MTCTDATDVFRQTLMYDQNRSLEEVCHHAHYLFSLSYHYSTVHDYAAFTM